MKPIVSDVEDTMLWNIVLSGGVAGGNEGGLDCPGVVKEANVVGVGRCRIASMPSHSTGRLELRTRNRTQRGEPIVLETFGPRRPCDALAAGRSGGVDRWPGQVQVESGACHRCRLGWRMACSGQWTHQLLRRRRG